MSLTETFNFPDGQHKTSSRILVLFIIYFIYFFPIYFIFYESSNKLSIKMHSNVDWKHGFIVRAWNYNIVMMWCVVCNDYIVGKSMFHVFYNFNFNFTLTLSFVFFITFYLCVSLLFFYQCLKHSNCTLNLWY